MPRVIYLLIGLFLVATGCHGPSVRAQVKATVRPEFPTPSNSGPVIAQAVPPQTTSCGERIAIIDVDGLLLNTNFTGLGSQGENPVSLFRERLEAIAADGCVKAVVIRINSYGGGVTATDIMWHDLTKFKQRTGLPVVACLLDVATGGAYYLATGADHIVAHPTTVTGGIGVILNLYNMQDAMAQFNVIGVPIKAGSNIDMGTPIKPMDPEGRSLLQTMAEEFHGRFKQVVGAERPDVDLNDATLCDGRVFTARQAHERQLIDSIGYLDDALEVCRQISGSPSAQAVLFHRAGDQATTGYSITANIPLQNGLMPLSMPGLDRSKLPSFLYLWQPEPTMERLSGK
ncbi:MAG TPA: S49 family peptidase [Pirellulaceae bacterium]|nr:S49 family peptidase [Pirellulaceae bacterium]